MLALPLVALFAIEASSLASGSERYGEQKVAYHINFDGEEGDREYLRALGNVRNHIAAVGSGGIEVKVVLHGDGLNLLKNANSNQQLQSLVLDLRTNNLAFLICNFTLEGRDIDYQADLFEVFKEDIVPSGVAELSHLQAQGYTYIRP
jgi:intracellular sulfur oxidation DsrE/DsrF family protein